MEDIVEVVVSEPKQHPRDKNLLYSTVLMVNKKDAYQPFLAIHTREGKKVLEAAGSMPKGSPQKNSWDADLKEWVLMSRYDRFNLLYSFILILQSRTLVTDRQRDIRL